MSRGGLSPSGLKARRAAKRAAETLPETVCEEAPLPCPKLPYASKDAAEKARDRLHPGTPHKCWCGAWHLTTSGKHHGKRGRP